MSPRPQPVPEPVQVPGSEGYFGVLPGHTPASPASEFTVYDNKKPYKGFVFGGPGPRNGVEGGYSAAARQTADDGAHNGGARSR